MIQHFKTYADVLRTLGNARLGYCIFLDNDYARCKNKLFALACTEMAIDKTIVVIDKNLSCGKRSHTTIVYEDNISCIIDYAKTNNLVICIGKYSQLEAAPEYWSVFNEIHTDKAMNSLFKMYTDKPNIWLQRLLAYPAVDAYKPLPNALDMLTNIFGDWQPWHLLMLHKDSKVALQVLWDSREIIKGIELTTEQIDMLRTNCTFADDNSRLLYAYNKALENTAWNDYIVDYVEQY